VTKEARKNLGNIRGFAIQFIPYSEIKSLGSDDRIRKILNIVLGNNIIILQGKLKAEEESRLIGDTMAMIGHIKDFKGIELAVIGSDEKSNAFDRFRTGFVNMISGGDMAAITIIGPASVVKEIKRNPKKIELLLNK